jgi:hypothetical protein
MDNVAGVRSHSNRLPQLPFYVILVAAALTVALGIGSGFSNYDLAVKASIAVLALLAAACAVFWKPAVLPLAAYFAMVPFDNLLQTGGGTVTKMLAAGSVVVALLVMVDRRRTLTPSLTVVCGWFAFLLWAVMSLTWTIAPQLSFGWVTMVAQLFGLFAVFSMFRIREDEVRVLVAAIVAGGVACSLYGLWLYVHGAMVGSSGASQVRLNIQLGTNGSAGSINSDHFAGALVLPIALALTATLRLRGIKKLLGWSVLLVLFAGVFVSATRSAIIAFGLMCVYLMVIYPQGRKQIIGIVVTGFLASLTMPSVWLRFMDPSQGAGNGRYAIWSVGWRAFQQHWLAGAGAGDFRAAYQAAFLGMYQNGPIPPLIQDAHNMLVSTSVELGVIGITLLLVAWYFQFRAVSVIPRSSSLFDLRLGVEAGIIGLCFVALTLDVLYFKYLWIGFMIAVLVRNAYVCQQQALRAAPDPERRASAGQAVRLVNFS